MLWAKGQADSDMLADSGRFSSVLQHFLAQLQCSGFREGVAAMDSKSKKRELLSVIGWVIGDIPSSARTIYRLVDETYMQVESTVQLPKARTTWDVSDLGEVVPGNIMSPDNHRKCLACICQNGCCSSKMFSFVWLLPGRSLHLRLTAGYLLACESCSSISQ